ncbi:hypothetical protein BKA56DRAFT_655251 [Ilyonectria sp. MPI-CAGE-AT-0026]|nr:hypothetical protein BKA56DRAFT_655251 [Ilyonectria sp. MPI-CAGE-AT-0026]
MEVAVSLVAFVTAGIQSATIIYNTLSVIKDGPEVVRQAARNVQKLGVILSHLGKHSSVDRELRRHIDECAADLKVYEVKLGKLAVYDNERALGKLWKKIKHVVGEKDIAALHSSMANHIAILDLHLSTLQRDSTIEVHEEVRILSQNIQTYQTCLESRETAYTQTTACISQSVDHGISSIRSAMDGMSLSSRAQYQEILGLIKDLTDQLTTCSTPFDNSTRIVELDDEQSVPDTNSESIHVEESVTGLQQTIIQLYDLVELEVVRLARHDQTRAPSTKNTEVLDALSAFLTHLESMATPVGAYSRHIMDIQDLLKPLSHALMCARMVSLGPKGRDEPLFYANTMRLSRRERAPYDVGFATLDIILLEKHEEQHLRHNQSSYVDKAQAPEGDAEEVSYTVSLLPKTPGRMLKFSSTQYHTHNGTFLGIPSLSFNRTVPSDSPIFNLVSRGRMADLQKLLMQGQASLRDHDEHGGSLLQLVIDFAQFLVDHGADVDHLARCVIRGFNVTINETAKAGVFHHIIPDFAFKGRQFTRLIECRRVLLNAGADPMICYEEDGVPRMSALNSTFYFGTPETIELFLNHARPFADVNNSSIDTEGRSPFLSYCSGMIWTVDGFQMLMRRGANIQARDAHGKTSLHLCVWIYDSGYNSTAPRAKFDALVYLVQCGADVDAVDDFGVSVSQTAYESDARPSYYAIPRRGTGLTKSALDVDAVDSFELSIAQIMGDSHPQSDSQVGDIWDAVLAESGHDVAKYRSRHPRLARYTEHYTPADFRSIWQGKEERCPYYDEVELSWLLEN